MGTLIGLGEAQLLPPGQMKDWAYNTLDTTGTREIEDVILPKLTSAQLRIYSFERALQAPALSMMMRGVRVNEYQRNEMAKKLRKELASDERAFTKMEGVADKWDGTALETGWCPGDYSKRHKWPRGVPDSKEKLCERCHVSRFKPVPFNPSSDDQSAHLLYDLHKIPIMRNKSGNVSTDKDTLGRMAFKYPQVAGIARAILSYRDKVKQLGSLTARLGPDGRYYSSFNIGAAWTGRQSSSKNPFQLGGNLQNVAPRHRLVLEADPGMDMGYADYMQGESNIVAHLSGDEKYIEAHALGDVHTYVTRYLWPELGWTGDLKLDKKIAKQLPPWDPVEGHDYRFQCKRIQHGSNYGLSPMGISLIAHIPLAEAKRAYERYMTEFSMIPAWQQWVWNEIREHRTLVNPLGRPINLFGRPNDPHTHKQGLAFLPQSLLADIDNIAMWRIWYELEGEGVQLLAQVHDALLHQYPTGRLDLERRALQLMSIPVQVTDILGKTRTMTIGVEAAVGKNWGHKSPENPNGIDETPIAQYLMEHPLNDAN